MPELSAGASARLGCQSWGGHRRWPRVFRRPPALFL